MADLVGSRLRSSGRSARTVHVKAKYGDFRLITRAHTLSHPTNLGADIATTAVALLDRVDVDAGLRLLGVSVSGFETPGPEQLTLDSLTARPAESAAVTGGTPADPEATRAFLNPFRNRPLSRRRGTSPIPANCSSALMRPTWPAASFGSGRSFLSRSQVR